MRTALPTTASPTPSGAMNTNPRPRARGGSRRAAPPRQPAGGTAPPATSTTSTIPPQPWSTSGLMLTASRTTSTPPGRSLNRRTRTATSRSSRPRLRVLRRRPSLACGGSSPEAVCSSSSRVVPCSCVDARAEVSPHPTRPWRACAAASFVSGVRGRRPAREIATLEPTARSDRSRSPARPRRRPRTLTSRGLVSCCLGESALLVELVEDSGQ